jgi:hypothetical protein
MIQNIQQKKALEKVRLTLTIKYNFDGIERTDKIQEIKIEKLSSGEVVYFLFPLFIVSTVYWYAIQSNYSGST